MDPVGSEGDALIMQSGFTTLERIVNGESGGSTGKEEKTPSTLPPAFPAKKASLGYFIEAENRILKRELGQFDQIKHKLDNDYGLFNAWAERFFSKHRSYMVDALEPLAMNFAQLVLENPTEHGYARLPSAATIQRHIMSFAINPYVDQHIEQSTLELMEIFDGKESSNIEKRAKDLARVLVENLCAALAALPEEPEPCREVKPVRNVSAEPGPSEDAPLTLPEQPDRPQIPGPDDWTEIGGEYDG
jgi:hypothetical protein